MSDLAFDSSGEPFELPATAAFWRVRRFRNAGARGGPEVVFGRDGSPLILPIETDLVEFREYVMGAPGRYRLDPLDQRQRPVEDVPAAYLQIAEPPKTTPAEDQTSVIRELVRANVDMTKTIADKFAAVMQSAAELLWAADGAGLPARTPPVPETRNATVSEAGDDDDDEPRSELAEIIKQVMPLVQLAVMRMLNGQSGAETRNASETSRACGKREPAHGSTAVGAGQVESGGAGARDMTAHLQAIEAELGTAEVDLVRRSMAEMAPDVLQSWAARLCAVSVVDAVRLVRAEMSKGGDA